MLLRSKSFKDYVGSISKGLKYPQKTDNFRFEPEVQGHGSKGQEGVAYNL